jgi:hypothetical protein
MTPATIQVSAWLRGVAGRVPMDRPSEDRTSPPAIE